MHVNAYDKAQNIIAIKNVICYHYHPQQPKASVLQVHHSAGIPTITGFILLTQFLENVPLASSKYRPGMHASIPHGQDSLPQQGHPTPDTWSAETGDCASEPLLWAE